MKNTVFLMLFIAAAITTFVISCNNNEKLTAATQPISNDSLIMRGSYLVNAIGCDDCHSPKRMGPMGPEIIPELRFSGFQHDGQLPPVDTTVIALGWTLFSPDFTGAVGQWGASYAGNISSDETGIGNWTEDNFVRAIREGKLKGLEGSRDLLPPMPWFVYKNMTDEDIKSIFAFLKTTKPVENIVPAPKQLSDLK